MEIRAQFVALGPFSFATGYTKFSLNLFDEVRRNPDAVYNRLRRYGNIDAADWVFENFIQQKTEAK